MASSGARASDFRVKRLTRRTAYSIHMYIYPSSGFRPASRAAATIAEISMLDFALNLRRLMARLGMTLEQVVEATGLSQRTVKALLAGKSKPHARTLHQLAEGLGVSSDELFQNPSLLTHRHKSTPHHAALAACE